MDRVITRRVTHRRIRRHVVSIRQAYGHETANDAVVWEIIILLKRNRLRCITNVCLSIAFYVTSLTKNGLNSWVADISAKCFNSWTRLRIILLNTPTCSHNVYMQLHAQWFRSKHVFSQKFSTENIQPRVEIVDVYDFMWHTWCWGCLACYV